MTGRPEATPTPGFSGPPVLGKVDGLNWRLLQPLTYRANEQTFTVPAGTLTDLASVPRPVAWLVPRSGASVPAAVLHDHLWRVEAPAGAIAWRDADGILRQALRRAGVPFVQRWLMWAGVRWSALFTRPGGHVDWWRDLPAVLAWTALGLPLVLPPALLALAALLAVAAAEAVAWLILAAGRAAGAGGRKQLNPPGVTPRV